MTFAEFCKQFTDEELPHITIGKRYFSDPLGVSKIGKSWDLFSAGIYLGEEKRGYRPTSALIDMLAQKTKKRVVVDKKARWLFLCGNDVLMQGVLDAGSHGKGDIVIVEDNEKNVLGYGEVTQRLDSRKPDSQYVRNKLDKGEYLRRESG